MPRGLNVKKGAKGFVKKAEGRKALPHKSAKNRNAVAKHKQDVLDAKAKLLAEKEVKELRYKQYCFMPLVELNKLLKDPNLEALDVMFIRMIMAGIKHGCQKRFEWLEKFIYGKSKVKSGPSIDINIDNRQQTQVVVIPDNGRMKKNYYRIYC